MRRLLLFGFYVLIKMARAINSYDSEFGLMQMLIERLNHKELTPDELQSLKKLHSVIDQAIADGKVEIDQYQGLQEFFNNRTRNTNDLIAGRPPGI